MSDGEYMDDCASHIDGNPVQHVDQGQALYERWAKRVGQTEAWADHPNKAAWADAEAFGLEAQIDALEASNAALREACAAAREALEDTDSLGAHRILDVALAEGETPDG